MGQVRSLPLPRWLPCCSVVAQTRAFGEQWEPDLGLLVHSAGVMGAKRTVAETIQVNVVAPCLLTSLLVPRLMAASRRTNAPSRVVNLSSSACLRARPDRALLSTLEMSDTHLSTADTNLLAYARSKLLLLLCSVHLRARLAQCASEGASAGSVAVLDVHPGLVWTNLLQSGLPAPLRALLAPVHGLFYKSPRQGAATVLEAALRSPLEASPRTGKPGTAWDEACAGTFFIDGRPATLPLRDDFDAAALMASPPARMLNLLADEAWARVSSAAGAGADLLASVPMREGGT